MHHPTCILSVRKITLLLWISSPEADWARQGSIIRVPQAACGPRGRFVWPAMLFGNFQLINIWDAKCLEKRCHELTEPTLKDTQCGFRPGRSTIDQIFTLQQIFEKSWEYVKNVPTHVLSTSRKHKAGFLVKSFGKCCRSAVLTAACYWPLSHCIPAQKFVSVSGELNRDRSPLVLDLTRLCAVTTPLHSLHQWDR